MSESSFPAGEFLSQITYPKDLRENFSVEQLPQVCDELRDFIIDVVSQKGGHFVCRHAHTMAVLRKMRKARAETNGRLFKFRGGMCNCELADLPQRNGLKSMAKLGDIPGKYGELR